MKAFNIHAFLKTTKKQPNIIFETEIILIKSFVSYLNFCSSSVMMTKYFPQEQVQIPALRSEPLTIVC